MVDQSKTVVNPSPDNNSESKPDPKPPTAAASPSVAPASVNSAAPGSDGTVILGYEKVKLPEPAKPAASPANLIINPRIDPKAAEASTHVFSENSKTVTEVTSSKKGLVLVIVIFVLLLAVAAAYIWLLPHIRGKTILNYKF